MNILDGRGVYIKGSALSGQLAGGVYMELDRHGNLEIAFPGRI
jgi:hypothetical protein